MDYIKVQQIQFFATVFQDILPRAWQFLNFK